MTAKDGEQKILNSQLGDPYILQIDLKVISKIKDWTYILTNTKIETALIKKIYKEEWPIVLCKFIHEKPAYIENLKKAISLNPKPSASGAKFIPEYSLRVSHIIPPEELKGFKNATETKKYLFSRLKVLENPKNDTNLIQFNSLLKNKSIQQELIQEVSVDKIKQETWFINIYVQHIYADKNKALCAE